MTNLQLPTKLYFLGRPYTIEYKDNPANVDVKKRESLWGQVDPWTNTIRVYSDGRPPEEVFQTILHEALHVITTELKIDEITRSDAQEKIIDLLATGLTEMLLSNGWVTLDKEGTK